MREFKNAKAISARRLADEAIKRAEALQEEARAAGLTVTDYVRLKNAQVRNAEIRSLEIRKGSKKPRRPVVESKPHVAPTFKELPKTQRWDGKKWVKIQEFERVKQ